MDVRSILGLKKGAAVLHVDVCREVPADVAHQASRHVPKANTAAAVRRLHAWCMPACSSNSHARVALLGPPVHVAHVMPLLMPLLCWQVVPAAERLLLLPSQSPPLNCAACHLDAVSSQRMRGRRARSPASWSGS